MKSVTTALLACALSWSFILAAPLKAQACGSANPLLRAEPPAILSLLEKDAGALLAAGDAYATAMEACYDGPLGPLELAPFVIESEAVATNMARVRLLAEQSVRDNERAYEDLLSSDLWGDIESLRVAGAYAAAWGKLAAAVRHISADDKRRAMKQAQSALRLLSFEFKHPHLVQRAMYGLATAQIEAGQLSVAQQTLERLQQSLRRGGAADFKRAVDDFLARISAPDYRPPAALFHVPKAASQLGGTEQGRKLGQQNRQQSDSALAMARQAMSEARTADEIVALLKPALSGDGETIAAALDLLARDQLLLRAMDYEPGLSLRVMQQAFDAAQYGQLIAAWRGLKPFYPHMPTTMKRQTDYRLGVAYLSLGDLPLAIEFLTAARKGLAAQNPQSTRLDKLIVLAQLSVDEAPTQQRRELAEKFKTLPLPTAQGEVTDSGAVRAPSLDIMLALRARIVLARAAALEKDWLKADKTLTGIGPGLPGYQLFLGMRVRLLAEAVKARQADGVSAEALAKTGRGAAALYRLWLSAECPPGCVTGNRAAVHRAAIDTALYADLPSDDFGRAWGAFAAEQGDIRPLVPRAIDYLTRQKDAARLMVLLEPDTDEAAAFVLGHWKKFLSAASDEVDFASLYDWLDSSFIDLQSRPKAALLEAFIAYDLRQGRAEKALTQAEKLAANFPRRPAAWFLRAAALQANARGIEATRALAALAQRTPADDPVGMGARLGMAALFVELERGEQACAMRAKIFSRPNARDNWQAASTAFPILDGWHAVTQKACRAG